MSIETTRSGFDAWVEVGRPSAKHPRDTHYRLRNNECMAYVWMKSPAPVGAIVTKATLVLTARGASTGSRNLIIHRVGASWKEASTNWNNRPATVGAGINHAIGTLVHGQKIEVDVTSIVQAWAGGAANYGFRINTSSSSLHYLTAFNSTAPPQLVVEWADRPSQPTDLRPSEAASGLAKPHVTFTYQDFGGNTELASVQVQINSTNSFTSPSFDSGEVATTEAGLDLATTSFAGLAVDQVVYWRVRARDGAGLWSSWSDAVTMSRRAKPTVSITNLDSGVAYETSPAIIWSVSATGGPRPPRFRVLVFDTLDPSTSIHDSGELTSSETSYTIPFGVIRDGGTYRVAVRVWDGWIREATPGDPTFASDTKTLTVAVDAAVGPVTGLTAVQVGVTPKVTLEWQRSTTPDGFVLYRDGVPIREMDPADVFVSGTTYRYTSLGARPNFQHTYQVRAVVNGRMSGSNPTTVFAVPVHGIWLIDRDNALEVTLWGDDAGSWDMPDDASVYTPNRSSRVVRIVSGMRNLEGSIQAVLMEGFGKSFEDMEDALFKMKANPMQPVQVVASDVSFSALLGNIVVAPTPRTRANEIVKDVSFSFWSLDPLPVKPRI